MVYHHTLPYPMTIPINTLLPCFSVLSTNLPHMVTLAFPSYSSRLPSYMYPPYYLLMLSYYPLLQFHHDFSLDIIGFIKYILNYSTKIPLTKSFFFVGILYLIVWLKIHEKIVFSSTPSPRSNYYDTSCVLIGNIFVCNNCYDTPPPQ